MEGFIGQIVMFSGNFAPRSWALCQGQLIAISQNSALFSILGTTYGGDGRTTFALPDLRGRHPMHAGNGPGLSSRRLGQRGGVNDVTLNTTQLPNHSHGVAAALHAENTTGNSGNPTGRMLGGDATQVFAPPDPRNNKVMSSEAVIVDVAATGGNLAQNITNPYLGVNFIICLFGTFPSRS